MQANISETRTGNWCIYTREPGMIATDWDATKQRIVTALKTAAGSNPLKPYYFSNYFEHVDKNTNRAIPNIKKDIIHVISIVAPDVTVTKIRHEANSNGGVKFSVFIYRGDESDILEYDALNGFGEFDSKGTVILESDAPMNISGYYTATLYLKPGLTLTVEIYAELSELYDAICAEWSAYGTYGCTERKIIAYINPTYPQAEFNITEVPELELANLTGHTNGGIEVASITVGPYSEDTGWDFANTAAMLAELNGDFKTTYGLEGVFYISDNRLYYVNYEAFSDAEMIFDDGIHSMQYSKIYA